MRFTVMAEKKQERNKIFECEYRPGEELVFRIMTPKLTLLPSATMQHLKSANKEMLLALRSIIDGAIEAMEREPKPRRGRTRIEVE